MFLYYVTLYTEAVARARQALADGTAPLVRRVREDHRSRLLLLVVVVVVIVVVSSSVSSSSSSSSGGIRGAQGFQGDGFHVATQDSSKGGAVETGCSGLHLMIGCFTV